jgi:hypothetical protein
MADPLAGLREKINEGAVEAIVWPDDGSGCPVKVGEIFQLRTCAIEITSTRQHKKGSGKFIWRAEFIRYSRGGDRLHLLPRAGGDYVHQLPGEGERDPTLKLDAPGGIDQEVLDRNLGHAPPEPEGVPPDEIPRYSGSKLARARYEREMTEARLALDEEPIAKRMQRVLEAQAHGANVGREVRAMLGLLSRAEEKIGARRVA